MTVADTGRGIAPDDLSNIFKKFYRGMNNASNGSPGCGLGLSIVQTIIQLHQGTITVNSQVGKGTAFIMEFPLI